MFSLSDIRILHRDEALIAVSKPSGITVHPSEMCRDRVSLMSVLRDRVGHHVWPIHRLDRACSGIVLFATSQAYCSVFSELFASQQISKTYCAIVRGWMPPDTDCADPLVDDRGLPQPAFTSLHTLARSCAPFASPPHAQARLSLIIAKPATGRYHQIRRHLRNLGHPIAGDSSEGDSRFNAAFRDFCAVDRLLLHSTRLHFTQPLTQEALQLYCPPDDDFLLALKLCGLGPAPATLLEP